MSSSMRAWMTPGDSFQRGLSGPLAHLGAQIGQKAEGWQLIKQKCHRAGFSGAANRFPKKANDQIEPWGCGLHMFRRHKDVNSDIFRLAPFGIKAAFGRFTYLLQNRKSVSGISASCQSSMA